MVRVPSILSMVEVVMKSLTASLSLARRQSKIFFCAVIQFFGSVFLPVANPEAAHMFFE